MSYENLCMNCMKEKGSSEQCPHCHFHNDSLQLPPFLPMRTPVGGHYIIGAVTESNGDGTTYMGYDTETKLPVTIREFLPDTMVKRDQETGTLLVRSGSEESYYSLLRSFQELWGKLQKMNGLSALVSVREIFEENNTAYAVSEYVEGAQSLRDYLLAAKEGYLSWDEARVLFMPVLSTLATLHQNGIIHRGISPSTLYIYPDHKVRISDFSIPECRTVNGGLTTEVFPGYTPVEQLGVQAAAGAWTDIYSFAAVLYRVLIGRAPIDAMVRMENDEMMIPAKFADALPDHVIGALVNALQVLPEDRTRNMDRFRAELSASQVVEFEKQFEEEEKARKRRIMYAPHPIGNRDDTEELKFNPVQQQLGSDGYVRTHLHTEEDDREAEAAAPKRDHSGGTAKTILTTVLVVLLIAALAFGILYFTLLRDHFTGSLDNTTSSSLSADVKVVEVPEFVGQYMTVIERNLTSRYEDFQITTEEAYSDAAEAGKVIAQSIDPGTKVSEGTTITLTVSKGAEQITMPEVVGNTYTDAAAKLGALGFKVSRSDIPNDGTQVSGTVKSASLSAGTQHAKGSLVVLQVWDEPVTAATEAPVVTEPETTTEPASEDPDFFDGLFGGEEE